MNDDNELLIDRLKCELHDLCFVIAHPVGTIESRSYAQGKIDAYESVLAEINLSKEL